MAGPGGRRYRGSAASAGAAAGRTALRQFEAFGLIEPLFTGSNGKVGATVLADINCRRGLESRDRRNGRCSRTGSAVQSMNEEFSELTNAAGLVALDNLSKGIDHRLFQQAAVGDKSSAPGQNLGGQQS